MPEHYDKGSRDASWKTKDFVTNAIAHGHPIAVRIEWSDKNGHFVVIGGHVEVNGMFQLYILDPDTGCCKTWEINEFKTSYLGDGTWDLTMTTKGDRPVPEG